jgi:hypothetical protein
MTESFHNNQDNLVVVESIGDMYGIKGWMSPSGKAHLFGDEDDSQWGSNYDEHYENHHPEFLKMMKHDPNTTQGPHSMRIAQQHGFVRFGHCTYGSMHGTQCYVHFDAKHPQGASTALKALHHMKPHYNDDVSISGHPGIWKPNMSYNRTANKQLETTLPAKDAYRQLYQQAQKQKEKVQKT